MVALTVTAGVILSVALTVVVLGSWWFTPETWIADATDNEHKTPVTPATVGWTVLLMLVAVGVPVAAAWIGATDHDAGFWERALMAYLIFQIFNLVDLVVIDIVIFVWIRPSWMTIEGYEMPDDYDLHVRGFVNGLAIGMPIAAVAAGVSALA
ncbi:MAG: hypothetical protein AAGA90_06635 [Actinomycetota bacterium]